MTSKTMKTILFASLLVAMILPFSAMDMANAELKTHDDKRFDEVKKHDSKIKKQLKKSDLDRIQKKIEKDSKISKHFDDKSVKSYGYSYTGNVYELKENPNKPLDIILHYEVDGESLTVLVDGETEEVIDSQIREITGGLLPDNGLIVTQFGGFSVKGLRMDYYAPNYSPNGVGWTAMLVNAAKNGSVTNDACNSSKVPNTYWAQSGLLMNQNGMELVWADTSSSCIPQYFTSSQAKPTSGQYIISQITANPSSNLWVIYGYNLSNGNFYSHTKTVSGTTSLKTGTGLTSVFFENPNDSSENWDPAYSADPKISKGYAQKVSNGGWYYWGSQTNYVSGCDPGGYNWSKYASGSLSSSGITYDVSDIEAYCGA